MNSERPVSKEGPRLVSVHIPKTAGSTFKRILINCYGSDVFFDYSDQYNFVDVKKPTLSMSVRRFAKTWRYRRHMRQSDRCIHGHFRASKYHDVEVEHRLLAWFRHPVERVASHYYHWFRNPDKAHSVSLLLNQKKLSIEDFARIDTMRNLQSRYLDGVPLEEFWFVGTQERFAESAPMAVTDLGFDWQKVSSEAENLNPRKAPLEGYDLSAKTTGVLESLNSEDMMIYEKVSELEAQRLASLRPKDPPIKQ